MAIKLEYISIYKKKKNLFLQTYANPSIPRWKPHKSRESNDRDPRFHPERETLSSRLENTHRCKGRRTELIHFDRWN